MFPEPAGPRRLPPPALQVGAAPAGGQAELPLRVPARGAQEAHRLPPPPGQHRVFLPPQDWKRDLCSSSSTHVSSPQGSICACDACCYLHAGLECVCSPGPQERAAPRHPGRDRLHLLVLLLHRRPLATNVHDGFLVFAPSDHAAPSRLIRASAQVRPAEAQQQQHASHTPDRWWMRAARAVLRRGRCRCVRPCLCYRWAWLLEKAGSVSTEDLFEYVPIKGGDHAGGVTGGAALKVGRCPPPRDRQRDSGSSSRSAWALGRRQAGMTQARLSH